MKKITWDESLDLASPHSYILVTSADAAGKPNIMGLSWWTFINWEPPLMAISVGNGSLSCKNIKETGEFAACFPSEKLAKGAWLCGNTSGRKVDKFKETGLKKAPSKSIKPPLIDGSTVAYECKVIKQLKVEDHTTFIGKIVNIQGDFEFKKHLYTINYNKVVSIDMNGNCNFDLEFK
jgi:flavin reductase (DIM6/NTAB) family NADH-FMN oxidoreductase RutF